MKDHELSKPLEGLEWGGVTNTSNIETKDERLAQALSNIERGLDPHAGLETQLMLEELLPRLEQARIVPIVENPNPYDTDEEMHNHELWWNEHPDEAATFLQAVERRNEVLRILYVGTLIGSGPWPIP